MVPPAWLPLGQSAGQSNGSQPTVLAPLCSVGTRLFTGCKSWAGSWQDMGLAERARALRDSWRENTAAVWASFYTSAPRAIDCCRSGLLSFLCISGSPVSQGNRAGASCSIWKEAETDYPAGLRSPDFFLPSTSRYTKLPATLEGDNSAGWYLLKALL